LFIFNNQIYGFGLMSKLESAPLDALLALLRNVFVSLWLVLVAAWTQMFAAINPSLHGVRTIALYVAVILAAFAIAIFFLFKQNEDSGRRQDSFHAIGLGFFLLPFAGAPFWLTGLTISLAHPASRFTLPFMFAVCLIVVGLISLIPRSRCVGLLAV
jgi:hypothetical protein